VITDEIRKTLSEYFVNMKQSVTLVIQTGEHSKRAELVDFLESVCALSPLLKVKQKPSKDH
jgi:alkyl hydroperoxide reductase subunit F